MSSIKSWTLTIQPVCFWTNVWGSTAHRHIRHPDQSKVYWFGCRWVNWNKIYKFKHVCFHLTYSTNLLPSKSEHRVIQTSSYRYQQYIFCYNMWCRNCCWSFSLSSTCIHPCMIHTAWAEGVDGLQPRAGHLVLNIICSVCLQFPRAPLYRIALSQENLLALLNEWATLNNKTAESVFCDAKKLYSVENEKGGKHWIRSTSRGLLDTHTTVFVWVNKEVKSFSQIK